MPGTAKKELYVAKSMAQLNEMAELPAKFKSANVKLLVKTADKMLKEAEHQEILQDEERAYVLFMKYFNVVSFIKKTADYKKQKTYYDNLIGSKNLVTSLDKAESLSESLKNRYDLLEAESVAKKLEVLDRKQDKDSSEIKDTDKTETKQTDDQAPAVKEEEKKQEGVVSCTQLYNLIEDRDAQLIIMDVRSIAQYQESRINYKNVINVPAEAITPGTTVTYIQKALPMDSLSLWKQRGNIDHIILLDWNTTPDRVRVGTTLQTLKDALFKYDSTVIIKSEPLVLDGGYEQWLLHYPTKCLNPDFKKLSQPTVNSSQGSLLDFDYPDFEETFMKPTPPPTMPDMAGSSSGSGTSMTNGTVNGDLSINGSMPKIDRSTKPKVDRSTKTNLNVAKVDIKSTNSGSLYPDVKSVAGPITNFGRNSSYADSRDQPHSYNADTRSINSKTLQDGGQRQTDVVTSELNELEKLKQQKKEELAEMQRKHEEMVKQDEARLENMRKEEERLSEIVNMRKKEQTDVVDLLRMKRNLQEGIASETLRAQSENERKEKEEAEKKRELDQIELEKSKREQEVNRLRMERKRKEEEQERLEKEKKDRELQEAKDRSRQEEARKMKELEEAEERARQIRLEEEKKKELIKQREEEERKRREKELQEKLEREQEDKRKQLLMEKQLEERRAREEVERKEKEEKERLERQERERKAREEKEEEQRLRAEEAKKIADNKIRLMNEPARVGSKPVPSPNLLVGWERKLDPSTRRYFYVNHNEGTTQWEPPSAPGKSENTYTTKLKEEPTVGRRGLSRSNSSPNIAKMLDDESREKKMPVIDRGSKPVKKFEPMPRPQPMPVKRRDLNPVYGNVGRALTGLRNLGNTCYMNSTVQCLNNTSPLVTYLLTDMYLYDVNRESPLGNNGEVADDLAFVVKALWSGQYRFISPRDFKHVVGKHQPMFSGYDQQDSQEFLTFLLDGLHEGLNKVKTRPKIPEQDNDRLTDSAAAELAWKNHKLQNESIIVELFQGQLKSTIRCLTCNKQSVTFQAFMFLSLPIPSSSRCSLQDCLRQFSANEKMTGSSQWKCPKCKTYRDSVKTIEIWKVPRILLIALNRFVYEGQWRTKINAYVDFPIRDLRLDNYVKGPPPSTYKLYAVSNHFGTLDGGHYTACCRNPGTQKWYKFDDHEVYETGESSIKTSAAYVLYYTSVELPSPEFRPNFG